MPKVEEQTGEYDILIAELRKICLFVLTRGVINCLNIIGGVEKDQSISIVGVTADLY